MSACGERQHLLKDCDGGGDVLDVGDGERLARRVLADFDAAGVHGEVGEQAAEHWRHVICLVAFTHEIDIHYSALEVDLLDAEASGQAAQLGHHQQLAGFGRDGSEAVGQARAESLHLVVAVD